MLAISVSLLIILILLSVLTRKINRYSHLEKLFPTPTPLPIIGHVTHFWKKTDTLYNTYSMTKNYGLNLFVYIFHLPYLLVHDPKMIEFILSSDKLIDKPGEYLFLRTWLGEGLITSTGKKWQTFRKILTPCFHYKILEEFVKVIDKQSTILVEKLNDHVGKDSVDIFNKMSLFTLDVICETAMGTPINAQDNPESPFVRSLRELNSLMFLRVFTPLRFNWIYFMTKYYQKEKLFIKVMGDHNDRIIEARRKAISKEFNDDYQEDAVIGLKRKYSLLDCLLRSEVDGKPIPNSVIREQVDTFMFAGHDTSSVGLSFTLFLLSTHPDIQERAYQEVLNVFGDDLQENNLYERLSKLKYLEQVLKESMRLFPPVPTTGRIVSEDIMYGDILLPKGLTLAMCSFVIHRNSNIYPDPEKFDPERFTHENQSKRHPFSFIPFNAGPRNCIGQKFAMLELKITVAKILKNYVIFPAIPEHKVMPVNKVTLESENGVRIRLKRRKN